MESFHSNDRQLARVLCAGDDLAQVVQAQAKAMRNYLGFGWLPCSNAPSTHAELTDAYDCSVLFGTPLPVSNRNMERTIFRHARTNHAMRFWHDVTHICLRCDFSLEQEAVVAASHLDVLRSYGYRPDNDVHRLLHIDTFGQNLCAATIGRFPSDQLRFAVWAFFDGIEEAIAYEAASITGEIGPAA